MEKWASKHHVDVTLYRFSNGDDLIRAHHTHCKDLIILDIIMPLLNGMDTAKELRQEHQSVPIIFLTSSREFAVDSYEVKALNYLMKPVDPEKLFAAMDDFTQTLHREKETFTAQTSSGFCRITLDDAVKADATFTVLMGEKVEPRKEFIEQRAKYAVNLDY